MRKASARPQEKTPLPAKRRSLQRSASKAPAPGSKRWLAKPMRRWRRLRQKPIYSARPLTSLPFEAVERTEKDGAHGQAEKKSAAASSASRLARPHAAAARETARRRRRRHRRDPADAVELAPADQAAGRMGPRHRRLCRHDLHHYF